MKGIEGRNLPRVDVCLAAQFIILRGRSTERVEGRPAVRLKDRVGAVLDGSVLDVSANGAYLACDPPPLLSRLMLRFRLECYGTITGVARVIWQRKEDEVLTNPRTLRPRGVGVLFEHIPLAARIAIQDMAARQHLRLAPRAAAG